MSAAIDYSTEIKTVYGVYTPGQEFKTLTLPSGVEVGVVKGFLATWDLDEGGDRFHKGAFLDSIAEHVSRNNRQVRLSDEHWDLMGGFPIETVHETAEGLFVEAHINLKHSKGKDIWELIKQGVVVDFSIGFRATEWKIEEGSGVRNIFKAEIWHGSTVGEPMNRAARILDFKSRAALPIASGDTPWNYDEAWKRIQASSVDPRLALLGRKCVCDMIEGKLTVIPEALEAAVGDIAEDPEAVRLAERFYAQMKKASPFDREHRQYWTKVDIDQITAREMEGLLMGSGAFSKTAARSLVGRIKGLATVDDLGQGSETSFRGIMRDLRGTRADLVGS